MEVSGLAEDSAEEELEQGSSKSLEFYISNYFRYVQRGKVTDLAPIQCGLKSVISKFLVIL